MAGQRQDGCVNSNLLFYVHSFGGHRNTPFLQYYKQLYIGKSQTSKSGSMENLSLFIKNNKYITLELSPFTSACRSVSLNETQNTLLVFLTYQLKTMMSNHLLL